MTSKTGAGKIGVRHRILRRIGLAALLPLAACAGAAEPVKAEPKHPALWTLADSDTRIWLFGTIHLLPEGEGWRTAAFDSALAGSDELVLEVADVDDMMASAQALAKLGLAKGLPPIAERVPEARRAMVIPGGVAGHGVKTPVEGMHANERTADAARRARERAGKGASRALRREGRVPAVVYGDKKEPLSIHVEEKLLPRCFTGHFMNSVVMIDVGGKPHRTLPKDVQFHPVSSRPIHVDFLRIGEHSKVTRQRAGALRQ
jgi:ribosomal protein L25 (general stress protein Ctc)